MRGPIRTVREFFARAPELHPVTLRFVDAEQEAGYQEAYVRANLPLMRIAILFGIGGWVVLGILGQQVLSGEDATIDAVIRFGVAVPVLLVGLAATYRAWFAAHSQPFLAGLILFNGVLWLVHQSLVESPRIDWGYVGLMLVLAFTYILSRMQFRIASVVGAVLIAGWNVVALYVPQGGALGLLFADYFLIVFAFVGMAASYGLERSDRRLFQRQGELDRERRRADELLRNTLPDSIVARLKGRDPSRDHGYLADGHPSVTVLFADLVGFTRRSSAGAPQEVVSVLDRIFTHFDALAERFGLEKIKTIGDAYMAVAGAPDPRPDHAQAAAEMAFGIVEVMVGERWPNGENIDVRVGIATGPAVAGVIGRSRFAYDLWGDTVNVASRLESNGVPGRILVSETTGELLAERYELGEPTVIELKGKGPTTARFLLGRRSPDNAPSEMRSRAPS